VRVNENRGLPGGFKPMSIHGGVCARLENLNTLKDPRIAPVNIVAKMLTPRKVPLVYGEQCLPGVMSTS
jgi:hypothetical protein